MPSAAARDKYADGKPVDVTGEFADKTTIVGADGLLDYLQSQDEQVMTTLSKKMMGYALGRTVLASDRPLLDEDDGGRRRRLVFRTGGEDHHQPAVPQPGGRDDSASTSAMTVARQNRGTPSQRKQVPMSINRARLPSRRHFLRGMGVALALPWMESLPLFAQAAGGGQGRIRRRCGWVVFFSNGVEPIHWWAKGSGANMQLGPGRAADDAAPRRHGFHPRPLQPDGRRLDQPASRSDERTVGRDGQPRSQRHPRRHFDGSGARVADR